MGTSERDRFTTFFVPPPQGCRVQRYGGVDLEHPAGLSGCPQRVAELLFERRGVEWVGLRRPVADRGVDVGQDDVRVTRGHDRVKTLQIRLNEDELGELTALAQDGGYPFPPWRASSCCRP